MRAFIKSKPRSLLLLGSVLSLGYLTACNSDTTSVPEETQSDGPAVLDLAAGFGSSPDDTLDESRLPTREQIEPLLKEMGFTRSEFIGNHVVMEGDIVHHRSDFLPFLAPQTVALGKASQRFKAWNLRVDRSRTWRIWFSPAIPANWRQGARSAIAFWYNRARIKLVVVNKGPYDIYVSPSKLQNGVYAVSLFPNIPGRPGSGIGVDISQFGKLDQQMIRTVMIHELGHSFGFHHTDGGQGEKILLTPDSDPISFMNQAPQRLPLNGKISFWDATAIHLVYPI